MDKLPPQLWCYFSPKLGQKFPRPAMPIIPIYKCSKCNRNTNHKPKYIHGTVYPWKCANKQTKRLIWCVWDKSVLLLAARPLLRMIKIKDTKNPQYVVSYLRNVLTTLKKNWVKHSRRGMERKNKGPEGANCFSKDLVAFISDKGQGSEIIIGWMQLD